MVYQAPRVTSAEREQLSAQLSDLLYLREKTMANPGTGWAPPRRQYYTTGLCKGLPLPDMPQRELDRAIGRKHISTYCEDCAVEEYDAYLRREPYVFKTPETDAEGYLVSRHVNGYYEKQQCYLYHSPYVPTSYQPPAPTWTTSCWSLLAEPDIVK